MGGEGVTFGKTGYALSGACFNMAYLDCPGYLYYREPLYAHALSLLNREKQSYDYTLQKVKKYTRIPLGDVVNISKGEDPYTLWLSSY